MKTDELIDIIAKDQIIQTPRPLWQYFGFGALILIAYTVFLFFSSGMGIRANYPEVLWALPVLFKQILPLFLLIALYSAIKALRFPESRWHRSYALPIAIYFAFMLVLFISAWLDTPADVRKALIMGSSRLKCLITIPIYAWVVMGFLFVGLRQFAPTKRTELAVLTAFVATALAIVIYAMGCIEDSPLFYAIWYNLALAISVLIGAILGYYWLKW